MVKYYEGTTEPIPDGGYFVYFKRHPVEQRMRRRDEVDMNENYNMMFPFTEYNSFTINDTFFIARPRDDKRRVLYFPMHNILHIECVKNSPEVVEALLIWNGEVVIDDDGNRHRV